MHQPLHFYVGSILTLLLAVTASPFYPQRGPVVTTELFSSTHTKIVCTTRKTSTSAKHAIPTTTIRERLPPLIVVGFGKETPIKTITPALSTATRTVTNLITSTSTASAITDVFSTTSTIYQTITVSSTIISVATEVDTVSSTLVATSTIAAAAGFIPIDTSSGDVNASKKKREEGRLDGTLKRGQPNSPAKADSKDQQGKKSGFCASSQVYPVAVTCANIQQVHYTEAIIVIEPTSTKTLLAKTTTVSTTITSVSVSTVLPSDVSTTLSFSSTISVTLTLQTTLYQTTTSTSVQTFTSSTTVYGACATPNLLGPAISNGHHLQDSAFSDSSASVLSPSVGTAYDCCVACQTTANCDYSAFATTLTLCDIIVGAQTCSSQSPKAIFYETANTNQYEAVYSNGPCGTLTSGGVV